MMLVKSGSFFFFLITLEAAVAKIIGRDGRSHVIVDRNNP